MILPDELPLIVNKGKKSSEFGVRDLIKHITLSSLINKLLFLITLYLSLYFIILLFHSIATKNTVFIPIGLFHFFHLILNVMVLVSDYFKDFKRSDTFNYGYSRSIILSSFTVSLFLILFSISVLFETIEEFFSTKSPDSILEIHLPSSQSFLPLLLGLFIYLIQMCTLIKYYRFNSNSEKDPHYHGGFLIGLSGFTHSFSLAAASHFSFSSLPDLVSEQSIPLLHAFTSFIVIDSAKQLLKSTFMCLMQATPEHLLEVVDKISNETRIDIIMRKIKLLEGVVDCTVSHFWSLTFSEFVGVLHINTTSDANEKMIRNEIITLFQGLINNLTIQIDKLEDTTITSQVTENQPDHSQKKGLRTYQRFTNK